MKFHLAFTPSAGTHNITHTNEVLLMGSCFSEHIGSKLRQLKFNTTANPFGIVFNPKSIAQSLHRILEKQHYTEAEIFEREQSWYCPDAHSSITQTTRSALLTQLNAAIDEWHLKLQSAQWLMITFGTAYHYRHLQTNHVVSNCHKLPQALFTKELNEPPFIVNDYVGLIAKVQQLNPTLKVLFTVSPVKHLRDGVVENSLSKAILIHSIHKITSQTDNCFYFPAYELVTDDLRDYRFYEADLAHPTKQAIDYVWQKFSATYFDEQTHQLNQKIEEINQAKAHRPFHENTSSHEQFRETYYKKCVELKQNYPLLDLETELHYFNSSTGKH